MNAFIKRFYSLFWGLTILLLFSLNCSCKFFYFSPIQTVTFSILDRSWLKFFMAQRHLDSKYYVKILSKILQGVLQHSIKSYSNRYFLQHFKMRCTGIPNRFRQSMSLDRKESVFFPYFLAQRTVSYLAIPHRNKSFLKKKVPHHAIQRDLAQTVAYQKCNFLSLTLKYQRLYIVF